MRSSAVVVAIAAVLCLVEAGPGEAQARPVRGGAGADSTAADTAGAGAVAYHLGEIVASVERPVSEAAATVRVVTAREIRETGARTLDEALMLVPGLNIRTGGQGVPRVDLRGLRSRHVLLLLNGIPLNSTYDGQFDPAFIPAEEIARIKVTTGTGSVLYGEGGLAGTINIVTRSGGHAFSGATRGEVREVDGRLVAVRAGGGTGTVSAFVSGSAFSVAGFPSVAGSPAAGAAGPDMVRRNSDRERLNGMALVTASPAAGVELGLTAGMGRGAYGIPPEVSAAPDDPFARNPTYDRVAARDDGFAQLAASLGRGPGRRLRSWLYLNGLDLHEARYDDSTYSSMDDVTTRGTYDSHSRTRLTGVGLQAATASGPLGRVTLGLSAQHDAWSVDLRVRDVAEGSGQDRTWGVRSYADERGLARYGAAVEYDVRPTHRLGLVAGYMRHWLRRDGAADTLAAVDRTSGADGYMAALSFDASSSTRLRVAASRKFRFPTIRQLYDEEAGNPTLATERAGIVEVGVHRSVRAASFDVTLFRMLVRDYIERPARNEPFANFQRYRVTGVELASAARPVAALTMRGSYTYMDAVDVSAGAAREALQYRPRHRATLEAIYAFPMGLSATATGLYVADQYYYSRQAPIEQARLPAYTVIGLKLAQNLPWRGAELYAGVDDLFDTAYEEEYGSPQATRTFYLGARASW